LTFGPWPRHAWRVGRSSVIRTGQLGRRPRVGRDQRRVLAMPRPWVVEAVGSTPYRQRNGESASRRVQFAHLAFPRNGTNRTSFEPRGNRADRSCRDAVAGWPPDCQRDDRDERSRCGMAGRADIMEIPARTSAPMTPTEVDEALIVDHPTRRVSDVTVKSALSDEAGKRNAAEWRVVRGRVPARAAEPTLPDHAPANRMWVLRGGGLRKNAPSTRKQHCGPVGRSPVACDSHPILGG
jgi:hypothetical protein